MLDGPSILRRDAVASLARRLALPLLATCSIAATAALPSGAAASEASGARAAIVPGASVTSLSAEQLQRLLSQIAAGETGVPAVELSPAKLAELLVELPGFAELRALAPGGSAELEADLRKTLEELLGGPTTLEQLLSPKALLGAIKQIEEATHVPIAELIEELFGKSPEALLEEGLGSLDIDELLSKLLGSSEQPQQLLEHLLEALDPATLQEVLGTLPVGEPPESLNVGELASELGKTPEALAQTLGQAPSSLPATTTVVTKALENGDRLALVDGAEGLAAAVVGKSAEGIESVGGSGTPVGGHSSGGEGGAGGNGGSPGTTTVIVRSTPRAASASAANAGKLKLIGRHVHGRRVALVVQAPAAGRLTLSGGGVTTVAREAAKAERVTIATALTKARSASLRKRHAKDANVVLTVAFAPVSGAASKAVTSVTLR